MTPTIVWFTGLPASGKSTLAERTRERLAAAGRPVVLLDGDAVRAMLGAQNYGEDDRDAFYRTLAELAALVARQGVISLVAATAPRRSHRDHARATGVRVVEVWVAASLAEAEARDIKGLYASARRGDIATLPGIGVPYEPPEHPAVTARGGHDDGAVAKIVAALS